jgi:pyruvate/2-oxoglutarate dehydrogenase complex dihydrolipoamide acyltransferase (E2) component
MKEFKSIVADRRAIIDSLHRLNCAPTVVIDMDAGIGRLLAWLDALNSESPPGTPGITLRHAIMKATALSLREHPLYNCSYNGRRRIVPSESIDICAPVPVDIAAGGKGDPHPVTLFVVLPGTDRLGIREIAEKFTGRLEFLKKERSGAAPSLPWYSERPLFAAAASVVDGVLRAARPRFPAWEARWMRERAEQSGTFMVTDVSAEGLTACHGQLYQPFIAGLTTLAVRDDLSFRDGVQAVKKVLPMVLEFDHKLADAGPSSRLLSTIRRHLEEPEGLA